METLNDVQANEVAQVAREKKISSRVETRSSVTELLARAATAKAEDSNDNHTL